MLDIVRIPKVVPNNPDTAALKAVLVRVRMLVVIRARKLAVRDRCFFQLHCMGSMGQNNLTRPLVSAGFLPRHAVDYSLQYRFNVGGEGIV
jgi:hypothetical protein